MAVLGIISIGLLFVLFSLSFANLSEFVKSKRQSHPFNRDYYEIEDFSDEIEVTVTQEKIFNYLSVSHHATSEQIEFACDCTQSDIDELVFAGVIRLVKVTKAVNDPKRILLGVGFLVGLALVFYFANYYFLFKFNLRYVGIILYCTFFVVMAINYFAKFINFSRQKAATYTVGFVGVIVVVLVFYLAFGGRTYFHANAYSELITITEEEFSADVRTVDVTSLPIVDKQYGEKLGSLKLGEYPGIGSEFEAGNYSDIIYNGEQYLVAPLEYRGIFKWFNNKSEGTPGYILINKVTAETTLVNLRETTGEGMVYTPSAYFGTDLVRHAYYNGMSKYKLENTFFEIDEAGNPFYILQYSLPTIFINGGRDIVKIAAVNAITGDVNIYAPDEVPSWIESVYPPGLLLEQLNYWGSLQDGFVNSIFGQRGVLQPSNGKRTIMNDGVLYYFTGLTSAGSDESTIGFVYMNTRTKETKLFKFPGATEQAAMNKVVTLLPQNNIFTSFPIPINVNEVPTYFIAIKGEDGRIIRYVFMSVQELEVYGIAETKTQAYTDYVLRLGSSNTVDLDIVEGVITDFTTYIVDGNSVYWIEIDGTELYLLNVSGFDNDEMRYFISLDIGDTIEMHVQDNTIIELIED